MAQGAHRSRDVWAGALYVAIAVAAFWIARDYRLGTAARMGSGYFPMLVAGVLLAIGVASILRGLLRPGAQVLALAVRPVLFVTGACVAFALLLERAGFVPALAALCAIAAFADRDFRPAWRKLAILAGFVGACALVFVVGLGLPVKPFWR
ncbi:MAG: tripartite tricarboxylate transporter TctB family protein [Tagaea sp.]|nr:tripartite tricarboxylate transporter TctB family protein [Tagaea sp.]